MVLLGLGQYIRFFGCECDGAVQRHKLVIIGALLTPKRGSISRGAFEGPLRIDHYPANTEVC